MCAMGTQLRAEFGLGVTRRNDFKYGSACRGLTRFSNLAITDCKIALVPFPGNDLPRSSAPTVARNVVSRLRQFRCVLYAGSAIARREDIANMKRKPPSKKRSTAIAVPAKPDTLLSDVRELIRQAREGVARAIDSGLVLLYWHVGRRIRQDILKEKRAEYGKQIFYSLSRKLTAEFGRGFSQANLFHMVRFAEVFPDAEIVHALRAQLGWTHFREIIYVDDPLKRDFYAEMCRIENWNTRTLHQKVQSMLFERTALSKKPDKLIRQELKQLREEERKTSSRPTWCFAIPMCSTFSA